MMIQFPHPEWAEHAGPYVRDIRGPADDDVHSWDFDVAKSFTLDPAGDVIRLSLNGIDELPANATVHLVDRVLSRVIDLRVESHYEVLVRAPRADAPRFVLLVGDADRVDETERGLADTPTATGLRSIGPNPFNPTTVIRYELSKTVEVLLTIHDVRGGLVRELERTTRPAGRYEVLWRGDGRRGEPVASGVYFCVFEAAGQRDTRKMVLLK